MQLIVILSFIFLFIDQLSKIIITNLMLPYSEIIIIKHLFHIMYVKNTGSAFSMFQNSRIFLIIISLVAILLILKYLLNLKNINKIKTICYSLLLGGIIGNLIDRIIHGYVIDFISVYIGTYAFPVFNIADMCIVLGVFLLIYLMWKDDKNGNSNK